MVLSELNYFLFQEKIKEDLKKIKVNNGGETKPQSSLSDNVMTVDSQSLKMGS